MILLLKKLLARLLFPAPLLLMLLVAAAILLLHPKGGARCRKWGKILLVVAITLFLVAGIFGQVFRETLTGRYPPLDPALLPPEEYTLVVAGSGFSGAPGLAPELRFNDAMRIRLHEAGRIAAALRKRGIGCSIAAGIHPSDGQWELKHRALAAFFAPYGIAPERLIPIEGAANSRQEVIAFSQLPGCKILISEAYHLPRLMLLARKYRLDAIPPLPAISKVLSAVRRSTSSPTPRVSPTLSGPSTNISASPKPFCSPQRSKPHLKISAIRFIVSSVLTFQRGGSYANSPFSDRRRTDFDRSRLCRSP